ncbi:MAG: helix-turn-helix transcriptional regulator [Clostridia bacterium]|nr:helix-turn-helix transcriptional regulator [Clostridia bacterium]
MSKRARLSRNNLCGKWISYVRKGFYGKNHPKLSQEELTARLQVLGLRIDRTALSRIENGTRFLSDIEVACFASALNVPIEFLYKGKNGRLPEITDLSSLIAEDE